MDLRQQTCSTSANFTAWQSGGRRHSVAHRHLPEYQVPTPSLGHAFPLRRYRSICYGATGDASAPPYPGIPAYPSVPAYPGVPSAPGYPSAPPYPSASEPPQGGLDDTARRALARATGAITRYGWVSFWIQLSLSVVSSVILLFSVAFTSQSGPKASLYLTLFGIVAGFLSTFWNYGYTRTGMRMRAYLDRLDLGQAGRAPPQKVKKQEVMDSVIKGVAINIVGLGSTLLGVQALVGILVAKTLSNASANPFLMSGTGMYNPVLALDVFLVQAATNTLLGHFLSLVCSLWLLQVVSDGRGLRFQSSSASSGPSTSVKRGNAATVILSGEEDARY